MYYFYYLYYNNNNYYYHYNYKRKMLLAYRISVAAMLNQSSLSRKTRVKTSQVKNNLQVKCQTAVTLKRSLGEPNIFRESSSCELSDLLHFVIEPVQPHSVTRLNLTSKPGVSLLLHNIRHTIGVEEWTVDDIFQIILELSQQIVVPILV